jgi:hypothetical protein
MVATIAATRAFFLGRGRITGNGFREAFVDPLPGVQLAADRRVTDRLLVLREIIAEEIDGPALFNRAKVAGTVDEELFELLGDVLAFRGWPPRLGCVMEPWETSGAVCLEPGTNGVFIAVEALGNLRDTPALGIE